jgi:hypothetical protein
VNWWLAYWWVWMLGGFLAPELYALWRTKGRGTFSVQVLWRYLKVTPGRTKWSAAWLRWPSYLVGAFLLWLFLHATTGNLG